MSRIENLTLIIELQNQKLYENEMLITALSILLCAAFLGILLLIAFRNTTQDQH